MGKKKAKEATKPKKLTCTEFLRRLYREDKNVSNEKALRLLRKKFPQSRANNKAIITWKNQLRAEGIDIPKQIRSAGEKKKVKKIKKKKSKK